MPGRKAQKRARRRALNGGSSVSNTNQSTNNRPRKGRSVSNDTLMQMHGKLLPTKGILSPCANKYARALANPFTGPSACIPSFPAVLSRKSKTWSKGILSTSATTGFGFVICDPARMVVNNFGAVFFSLAGYPASTTTTITVAGQVGSSASNSDYAFAQIGTTALLDQYRVVSSGIRIRYVGTELERGGQLVGFSDPGHQTISGRSFSDIDGEEESKRFPIDRQWTTVLYRPALIQENDFAGQFPPVPLAEMYMGFVLQAATATTSLTFEWEFYSNFEIVGRNVRSKTVSEADPNGYAAVHTASIDPSIMSPHKDTPENKELAIVAKSDDTLNSIVSGVKQTIDMGTQVYNAGKTIYNSLGSLSSGNPLMQIASLFQTIESLF